MKIYQKTFSLLANPVWGLQGYRFGIGMGIFDVSCCFDFSYLKIKSQGNFLGPKKLRLTGGTGLLLKSVCNKKKKTVQIGKKGIMPKQSKGSEKKLIGCSFSGFFQMEILKGTHLGKDSLY